MSALEKVGEVLLGGLNWGLISSGIELFTYKIGNDKVDVPSVNIFDNILDAIVGTCIGKGSLAGASVGSNLDASAFLYSQGLFKYLLTFDFMFAIILGLIAFENGPNFLSLFMNKAFKYGFWTWIFFHWREICTAITKSFLQIGTYDRDISGFDFMMHPSNQITTGLSYSIEYFKFMIVNEISDKMILNIVIAFLSGLFIFISFFLIALNVFLSVAEFYICSALMLVFIPFALFDKTERFAAQTFNLVVSFGVRVMILAALVRMGSEFFGEHSKVMYFFVYKDAPYVIRTLMSMGLVFIYAYLCCEAPALASSIVSGALNLNSNNAIMHGYGAAAVASGTLGGIAKGVGTVAGAAQRASDAYSNGGGGIKGALGAVRGFNQGLGSGLAQGTIGGLEEGKAVYRTASGRTSGAESVGPDGKPDDKATVVRDAAGNVIGGAQKVNDYLKSQKSTKNDSGSGSKSKNDYVPSPGGVNGDSGSRGKMGDFTPPPNSKDL